MAVFNTFTFDGENSLDYGVYITGEAVYNAPERAVEMVSIPGKNGALALDQGRFENIEVTYPAGMFGVKQAAFAGRMRAMRNMLASRYNYVRLTDSYHPDEYRLGLYKSGLEAAPVAMSSAGEFDITFNCKPQRFLTSGEEPVDTSELGGEVTTDKIPYLFRRSGGGSIGHDFDAEIDKIIGGTVAWNQLFSARMATTTVNGVTATNNNDGSFTLQGTATADASLRLNQSTASGADHLDTYYAGHKYLFLGNDSVRLTIMRVSTWNIFASIYGVGIVTSNQTLDNCFVYMPIGSGVVFDKKITPQITDLTQAFGTEIADYVYNLEQTTSGSGIAWLEAHGFIDGSYRAFDSGSLQSVKTSEHRTVGFNQWDEEWELGGISSSNGANTASSNSIRTKNYIPIIPIEKYYCYNGTLDTGYNIMIRFYDAEKNYIGYVNNSGEAVHWNTNPNSQYGCIPPNNARYMRIAIQSQYGTTYKNDICINISDASKNGQYEPYESHSYPLDPDLELRGIPKLSNGSLYYDGDVYESSGAVTRKYGIKVLDGTEAWYDYSAFDGYYTNVFPLMQKGTLLDGVCNLLTDSKSMDTGQKNAMWLGVNNKYLYAIGVKDSMGASVADFKTYLASHNLVVIYPLETPTTEQADPYQRIQIVDNNGTEEYVDTRDVPVPVGHETRYGMSQLVLSNPTEFPSKPLLEVTGVGTFWLGDTLFTITGTAGQTIYIDCETGEAWKNTGGVITPANGLVALNRLDFPELDPGDTPVMYGTGITKVVVTPRWWII